METYKLVIARNELKDTKEDVEIWQEKLDEAPTKFIGKALETEIKQMEKYLDTDKVIVEALEKYIKDAEDFDKMDADQSKAEEQEQERLADNAQEHAQEMLAEEQQIKDEEREASDNNLIPQ